jgi:hypothetical protein
MELLHIKWDEFHCNGSFFYGKTFEKITDML